MLDDYALYTAINSAEGTLNLRYHAFVDCTISTKRGKTFTIDSRDDTQVIIYVSEHPILFEAKDKVGWLYL